MITEFVKFSVLETTADEQLISIADIFVNGFQKKQDGFIDVELVKDIAKNAWCFIFHYECMEKVKIIGEEMRKSKEYDEFKVFIVPGSISVDFYYKLRNW